jgi:hypothetical protein
MTVKRNKPGRNERLDAMGRAVVRAAASNADEAEQAASAPFLYARIRSRIAAEGERRAEGERWLTVLGVAWRAVPALVLVFALAVALLLSSAPGTTSTTVTTAQAGVVEEALAGGGGAVYERVVFSDRAALTGDEVLSTILEEGPEAQR